MSGKRVKIARSRARRLEAQVDREARTGLRVPWYIRPFRRWRARWLQRWEREHRAQLHKATKRMTHALVRLYK